jgi:hypothetical protein
VGATDADVVQAAQVAQGDAAGLVDAVVAHAELGGGRVRRGASRDASGGGEQASRGVRPRSAR